MATNKPISIKILNYSCVLGPELNSFLILKPFFDYHPVFEPTNENLFVYISGLEYKFLQNFN